MAAPGFRHHVGLKAVSIVLAFLLWLAVSGEQTVERAFRVPLEFTNLSGQLEIVGTPPETVDVRIKGSSGLVGRITATELSAVIDLADARAGERLFPLMANQIRLPFGLEIVQVTPSTVAVVLEASASRVVPVVPSVQGDPAPGFVVGTVTADPATVELVGPASAVSHVTEAVTEPVSVANATASVSEVVTVGPPTSLVRLRQPVRARVSVGVVTAPAEWAVAGVPVRVIGGEDVATAPEVVTIRLRAPRELVTTIVGAFEATASVEGLGRGDLLVPVRVTAPERVGVVSVDPPEVRVRVR
jgi:YbbR domain-containing protein